MIEDALRYPWSGEQKVETILIGGVLALTSFLIVPALFSYGYLLRVIRRVSAGDDATPPSFEDWGELLTDGIVTMVILLAYMLVPSLTMSLVATVTFIPLAALASSATGAESLIGSVTVVVFLVGTVLSLGLGLLTAYLLPAAVGAYAATGSIEAAFSPSTLRSLGGDSRFALAWLIAFTAVVLVQVISYAAMVTIVGIVVIPFLGFYGNVAAAYAIGAGIQETGLPASRSPTHPGTQPE